MSFIYISRKDLEMQYVNPLKTIRIPKLLLLLVLISFILQLIIMSYNQFTGYLVLEDHADYFYRLLFKSFLSFVALNIMIWPALFLIQWLNDKYTWNKYVFSRILIEFFLSLVFAIIIASIFTFTSHAIDPYKHSISNVLFNKGIEKYQELEI